MLSASAGLTTPRFQGLFNCNSRKLPLQNSDGSLNVPAGDVLAKTLFSKEPVVMTTEEFSQRQFGHPDLRASRVESDGTPVKLTNTLGLDIGKLQKAIDSIKNSP